MLSKEDIDYHGGADGCWLRESETCLAISMHNATCPPEYISHELYTLLHNQNRQVNTVPIRARLLEGHQ